MGPKEYDTWFDLYGYDGFLWEFVAYFDSREEAEDYADESEVMSTYETYHISRVRGNAS